jgi:hypothetical protein
VVLKRTLILIDRFQNYIYITTKEFGYVTLTMSELTNHQNHVKENWKMKKIIVLLVALAFSAGITSTALAATVSGEVTKVKGNEVTIEVSKSDAKDISEGDEVKMKVKSGGKKATPAASALVGC